MEIPEEGIRSGTLMQHQLEFVLEFKFKEPPEFLTLQQDMVAEGALLPSEVQAVLRQAGTEGGTLKILKAEQPETYRFDWSRPELSAEATAEELAQLDQWFEKQREQTLGITSYSSVYSFIYITDYEIRHEVLIPLATLSTLMELERADKSFLEIDEQTSAAKKIEAFFSVGNPVTIDGVEVQPVFDRIDFYGLDLKDFAMQSEKRRVSMASGRAGVIMSYSTKGRPASVSVTWDKFSEAIRSIDSVAIAYDQEEPVRFSKFQIDNTFEWDAPDRQPLPPITSVAATLDLTPFQPPVWNIPLVSAVLAGMLVIVTLIVWPMASLRFPLVVGLVLLLGLGSFLTRSLCRITIADPVNVPPPFEMSDQHADQVFAQLHKNMFRAFDYHDERDVYQALSRSVEGEFLRELYLQINRSMKIKEQGGAIARINEVNLIKGKQQAANLPPGQFGFTYRCKWNLIGTVEHWGHIHERSNQYDALFAVQLVDDAWKITSMEDQAQLTSKVTTSRRKLQTNN